MDVLITVLSVSVLAFIMMRLDVTWMHGLKVKTILKITISIILGNALACIAIIVDAEAKGILIDDRMYPGGFLSLRDKLTPEVMRIKNMYKGKTPHHYSLLDILGAKGGSKRQSKSAKSTKRSKRSKR
jgi:hypothetical protein